MAQRQPQGLTLLPPGNGTKRPLAGLPSASGGGSQPAAKQGKVSFAPLEREAAPADAGGPQVVDVLECASEAVLDAAFPDGWREADWITANV